MIYLTTSLGTVSAEDVPFDF